MTLRLYRYFQGLLMISLGLFLFVEIISGKLVWYINQRFIPLTVLAVIALLAIGLAVIYEARRTPIEHHHEQDDDHEHEHDYGPSKWRLAIVVIPLAIGILIPAKPLTVDALSGKGVSSSAPVVAGGTSAVKFDEAADERNILDWIRLFGSQTDASTYLGQNANVIGFVYHDPRLKENQFLVSRFAIVCCTADAFAIGMVVDWPNSASLPNDQWIKVKGPVQATELEGQKMPLIQAASVEQVQQPDQPYLFP
jgi:uncharacterized repeat protein (TIGR03943 family)